MTTAAGGAFSAAFVVVSVCVGIAGFGILAVYAKCKDTCEIIHHLINSLSCLFKSFHIFVYDYLLLKALKFLAVLLKLFLIGCFLRSLVLI